MKPAWYCHLGTLLVAFIVSVELWPNIALCKYRVTRLKLSQIRWEISLRIKMQQHRLEGFSQRRCTHGIYTEQRLEFSFSKILMRISFIFVIFDLRKPFFYFLSQSPRLREHWTSSRSCLEDWKKEIHVGHLALLCRTGCRGLVSQRNLYLFSPTDSFQSCSFV